MGKDVVAPRSLVVPSEADGTDLSVVPVGQLIISGAKLWVAVAANTWEAVTSA